MKLNKLMLQNIGLHAETEVAFDGSLIGVFGPNGSGKSTLLNAGFAALTNDFSRFNGGKEGAIRQQTGEREISRITAWGEHNNVQFQVIRTLHPKTQSYLRLTYADGSYHEKKKATEIQETLEGLLGVDRSMLDRYVFVGQWQLRALFEQAMSERAKTLAALCGTTHAELCWDLVGKQIESDRALVKEVVDDVDELRRERRELRKSLKDLGKQLQTATKDVLPLEEYEHLRTLQYKLKSRGEKRSQVAELIRLEQEQLAAAKLATKELRAAEAAYDAAQQTETKARDALGEFLRALNGYQMLLKNWQRKQRLQSEQQELETRLDVALPQRPLPDSSEELEAELAALREEMAPHELVVKSLGGLTGAGQCPTCGQALDSVEQHVAEAQEALRLPQSRKEELEYNLQVARRYEEAVVAHHRDRSDAKKALERVRDELQDLADCEEAPTEPEDEAGSREAVENAVKETARLKDEIRTLTRRRTDMIATHKATKSRLQELQEALQELDEITESEEELQLAIASHSMASNAAAKLEAQIAERKDREADLSRRIEETEAVQSRTAKAREWVAQLSRVREVLHRDNLPKLVHQNALVSMEAEINKVLADFESPFLVTASDDLFYEARFRNGTVMPAKGLSGGEQVMLSVAFRWVLNSLFAGQIGMLMLDEPTACLDSRNIALLQTSLRRLRDVAASKGSQVMVITHEDELASVFDQSICLSKAVI